MATAITPLGRRVLVKRSNSEEKTAGGIFLPDTAKEKPQEAEVLALGTGKDDEGKDVSTLFTVKKGDNVVTGGGLMGKATKVDTETVEVEIAKGVTVKAVKSMLVDVNPLAPAKAAND